MIKKTCAHNNELTLETLLNCLPGNIYWKSREGVYLGCNVALTKILGLPLEEIIGKTDYDLAKKLQVPKEVIDAVRKTDLEVIESALPQLNLEESPFNDKYGQPIQLLTNKMPFYENGKVIGVIVNSIDISYCKKIEHELRIAKQETEFKFQNSQMTLSDIIASLPGSVYWKNQDGIYLGCNDALVEMLGLPKEEIIGGTDYSIGQKLGWPSEFTDDVREVDLRIISTGIPRLNYEELPFYDKAGKLVYQLSSKVPLRNKDGLIVGVIGNSTDITIRKTMEEELRLSKEKAEESSRTKLEFVSNMSHEVRTPITGLIAAAIRLEEEAYTAEERRQARNMLICCNRLTSLFNAILDNVKSGPGNYKELNNTTFDLKKLMQELYDISFLNADAKKLNFRVELDPQAPLYIVSDRFKLYTVLFNLISNAIKFTHKGEVLVKVKYKGIRGSQIALEFVVFDTGIGISDDFKNKAFDLFSRETPSYKGIYKGYGIGLNTSQNYAKTLGSEIDVISEKGRGSTFWFELIVGIGRAEDVKEVDLSQDLEPRSMYDQSGRKEDFSTSHSSSEEADPAAAKSNITVLIVEDDHFAMKIAEMGVKKAGYAMLRAASGEEALEIATRQKCDLILTDIGLPKMSGDELAKRIREWEKANDKDPVPIIALTGHGGDSEVAICCLNIGMNEVLTKPASPALLEQVLKKYLSSTATQEKKHARWFLPEAEKELLSLTHYALFDPLFALSAFAEDPSVSKKILSQSPYELASSMHEIEVAHAKRDWRQIAYLALRVLSMGLYLGKDTRLEYACRYIGYYYKNGQTALLEKLYQQLISVIKETKEAIEAYLYQ